MRDPEELAVSGSDVERWTESESAAWKTIQERLIGIAFGTAAKDDQRPIIAAIAALDGKTHRGRVRSEQRDDDHDEHDQHDAGREREG